MTHLKNQNPTRSLLCFTLTALASVAASSAATYVLDDFSDGSLSEYTSTRILDNEVANAQITFSTSTGALVASYGSTGGSQPEQVMLLRSDYLMTVGTTMTVDVSQATSTASLDFGLAVASTAAPTAASVGDTDTRDTFQWAAVYVRPGQNSVRSGSYNGVLDTGTGILAADETSVAKLWITRDSATQFTLGYIDTLGASFTSKSVTFTNVNVGAAVGFYADMRVLNNTLGSLDNLTVPEPSVVLLGGLGVLGLLRRRRLG